LLNSEPRSRKKSRRRSKQKLQDEFCDDTLVGWRGLDAAQRRELETRDPVMVRICRHEERPARLSLTNQTLLALLTTAHPQAAKIVSRANEILKQWRAEQRRGRLRSARTGAPLQ
jgi:hypothetical protein